MSVQSLVVGMLISLRCHLLSSVETGTSSVSVSVRNTLTTGFAQA